MGGDEDSLRNIGNYLARIEGLKHLDAIYKRDDGVITSVVQAGLPLGTEDSAFFSNKNLGEDRRHEQSRTAGTRRIVLQEHQN